MSRPRIEPGGRRWLAVGAVVSLLAHAGLAVAIMAAPPASPRGEVSVDASRLRTQTEQAPPPPMTLGLERSRAVSVNWIGFEEPDPEHVADLESEVEQAALTTEAAGGPEAVRTAEETADGAQQPDGQPMAAQPPAQPPDQTEAQPALERAGAQAVAEAGTAETADAAEQAPAMPPATDAVAPDRPVAPVVLPEPNEQPAENESDARAGESVPEPTAEAMGPPAPTAEDLAERDAAQTPAPGQPAEPAAASASRGTQAGTGVGGEQPGEAADRDSVAAALKKAMNLTDWTKPIAGQGLEIKTVRPRWSLAVRATNWPQDPVIVIRFGADGRVRRAEFLKDPKIGRVFDTGSGNDVDGPLLDAVYQWMASGERLKALDPARADAVVEITIRVMLR